MFPYHSLLRRAFLLPTSSLSALPSPSPAQKQASVNGCALFLTEWSLLYMLPSVYSQKKNIPEKPVTSLSQIQCAQLTLPLLCCVVLVAQLCPTLCDAVDCSPPGSSVHEGSPGKDTAVGHHALLQRIFPTQGLNPGLPHCRQILYCLSHSAFIFIKSSAMFGPADFTLTSWNPLPLLGVFNSTLIRFPPWLLRYDFSCSHRRCSLGSSKCCCPSGRQPPTLSALTSYVCCPPWLS